MAVLQSLKIIGLSGMASYAMARACSYQNVLFYNRYKVIRVPAGNLPNMPRGYSARELSPEELLNYEIDAKPAFQAYRFASGLCCVGVFDRADELVGVTWLAKHTHEEEGLNLIYTLPDNAAWDTGMWVRKDKRMGRAFSAVSAAMKQWLEKEGLEWSMSAIADYNIASILSHRRLGCQQHSFVTIFRSWRFQLTFVGAKPHLYIYPKTRKPALDLTSNKRWS